MAYHIYHTRGIILSSTPVGETNQFYKILTEELGLISATAQGVREMKSKLRTVLQPHSCITLDLVRGKDLWRITSATEEHSLSGLRGNHAYMRLFTLLASLVRRMIHGEERNKELFSDIVGAAHFLDQQKLSASFEPAFEALGAMRVLARLGYVDRKAYERYLAPGVWDDAMLASFDTVRPRVVPELNAVLRTSHL